MENICVALAVGCGIHDWEDHESHIHGVYTSSEEAVSVIQTDFMLRGIPFQTTECKENDKTIPCIKYTDVELDMEYYIRIETHPVQ